MALMREPGGRGTGKEERRLVSTGFRFGCLSELVFWIAYRSHSSQ
jgi:hypothetical protein